MTRLNHKKISVLYSFYITLSSSYAIEKEDITAIFLVSLTFLAKPCCCVVTNPVNLVKLQVRKNGPSESIVLVRINDTLCS